MWKCKCCYTKRENPIFSLRKTGLCGKCQNSKHNSLPKFALRATHMTYCENCEIIDECIPGEFDPKINGYHVYCVFCENLMETRVFV